MSESITGPIVHILLLHFSASTFPGTWVPEHPHPLLFWSPEIPMSWYPIPWHLSAPVSPSSGTLLPQYSHPLAPMFFGTPGPLIR